MDKFYKALAVALKDLQVFLTDRGAAIAMLLVPLVVGFFSASMYGGGEGGVHLPVVVVNQDGGAYGESIVSVLSGIAEVVTSMVTGFPSLTTPSFIFCPTFFFWISLMSSLAFLMALSSTDLMMSPEASPAFSAPVP